MFVELVTVICDVHVVVAMMMFATIISTTARC